jgi:hypothetical protein
MFRILCDPSSGSTELCVTEITRSDSQIFVVCLVGVWQRNFEPVVCVRYGRMVVPEWFLILCLLNFYTTYILTTKFRIIECISLTIKLIE